MRKMFELGLVVATFFVMTGCAATAEEEDTVEASSSEIVNGQIDFGHAAVAAIRWQVSSPQGSGSSLCTGTLIAPRTVLTAGHCVVPADKSTTFSQYEVYFGTNAGSGEAKWLPVAGVAAHPGYDPQVFGAYDIAVVVLAQNAPVAPARVAKALPDLTGKVVTHVGFGTTVSIDRNMKYGAGSYKYKVSLPVTEQSNITLRTGNGRSGICNGDSGGPALVSANGADVVVGVHSYVDDADTCLNNGYSARTDIAYDFIAKYL